MSVEQGARLTVGEIQSQGPAQIVIATDGSVFGLPKPAPLLAGDRFELGPVCAGWAFLVVRGDRYRGKVLQEGTGGTETAPGA